MASQGSIVAIQRNPISGSGLRAPQLQRLVSRLKELDLEPHIFTDRDKLAAHLADHQFRSNLRCLVAAGGDGTVDDLLNRAPGVPLAVLALGTENLLAKYYRIPRNGGLVAEMICAGHSRTIDLGQANQRRFAIMASCGFDAHVVALAHQQRTGRITKMHYLKPIIQAIWENQRDPIDVLLEGDSEPRRAELVIISNIAQYASQLPVNPTASDDDGLFDVTLVKNASSLSILQLAARGLVFRSIQTRNIESFQTPSLTIDASRPISVQADGDPIGQTPLQFRVLANSLELIVPEKFATQNVNRLVSEPCRP